MRNNVKVQDDAQSLQSCVSVSVTDLRIGNYISRLDLGSGTPRTEQILELLSKRTVTSGPCRVIVLYEDIKPIPLTEEWLLKTGFYECNGRHGKYYKHNKSELFRVWMSDLCTCGVGRKDENSIGKEYNTYWMKLDLKYLHQLQNLYHALTGYELQVGYLTEH